MMWTKQQKNSIRQAFRIISHYAASLPERNRKALLENLNYPENNILQNTWVLGCSHIRVLRLEANFPPLVDLFAAHFGMRAYSGGQMSGYANENNHYEVAESMLTAVPLYAVSENNPLFNETKEPQWTSQQLEALIQSIEAFEFKAPYWPKSWSNHWTIESALGATLATVPKSAPSVEPIHLEF